MATELPAKYLPAVRYRDLPEPVPFRKVVGASVILLATALGSGETLLWPYITSQVGVGILWLAAVGFTIQYFLNMEIERYTLATGETAVTGFTRLWKPWGIFFVLGTILPNAWPGWATGAAEMVTVIFGMGEGAVAYVAIAGLIAIGVALTASPVVYQTVERVQTVLVGIILVFLVVAVFVATEAAAWGGVITEAPSGLLNFPSIAAQIGAATLLGAIAFAGAGGANNLCQSNYIRDKGMGMGAYLPKIVSPITGEEVAAPSLGFMMRTDEENLRRWHGWWSVANREQLITFWAIGLVTLITLAVLLASLIAPGTVPAEPNTDFLLLEGEALGSQIAPWVQTFFYTAVAIALFSTNLGIIDYVGRITADSLKVSFLAASSFWSESKIYLTLVWVTIVAGSVILLSGLTQPLVLIIIASAGGGVVMAFYSVLLIQLNTHALPEAIRLRGGRLVVMILSAIFFVALSVYLLIDQILIRL